MTSIDEILSTREKYKLLRQMRGEKYFWHFLWEEQSLELSDPTVPLIAPSLQPYTYPGYPGITDEDRILNDLIQNHTVAFAYFSFNPGFSTASCRPDYKYELFWLAHKVSPQTIQLWTADVARINIFSIKPLLTALNVNSIV